MDWLNIEFLQTRLLNIGFFLGILILTIITARLTRILLDKFFNRSSEMLKVNAAQYNFFKYFIIAVIYIVGIGVAIYAIPSLRTFSVSIFAGAGILAAIIGFASQHAFSNVVSGIFIVIFKPYRVNDWIQVGMNYKGVVEDITLRHTVIRNFENRRIVIPNSIISAETIVNSSILEEKIRKWVEISISYDSDVNKAIKIMQEEAEKHPFSVDNRDPEQKRDGVPVVEVRLTGFGESSVNLRAYVWADDPRSAFQMNCDLNKSIKERFDREGVEIPFPYRTIVYKKDLEAKADMHEGQR